MGEHPNLKGIFASKVDSESQITNAIFNFARGRVGVLLSVLIPRKFLLRWSQNDSLCGICAIRPSGLMRYNLKSVGLSVPSCEIKTSWIPGICLKQKTPPQGEKFYSWGPSVASVFIGYRDYKRPGFYIRVIPSVSTHLR